MLAAPDRNIGVGLGALEHPEAAETNAKANVTKTTHNRRDIE
jgi:hypothetical protein